MKYYSPDVSKPQHSCNNFNFSGRGLEQNIHPKQGLENLAKSLLALLIAFSKLTGYLGIRVFVTSLSLLYFYLQKE